MIDFSQAVLARSFTVPVVVDFWASWCGPCRVLGPMIEELAVEQKGRWELVKISTEEQPEDAQRYKVMSIPAVKLFFQGKVIAEFTGALPKIQIEKWLATHLPDPRQHLLAELKTRAAQDPEAAESGLRELLAADPDYGDARIALAQIRMWDAPEEALALIAPFHEGAPQYPQAETVRALARLASLEAVGHPIDQRLSAAADALREGKWETGISLVIETVAMDKTWREDLPRKSAIALFALLGAEHPLTLKYQRRFSMALY